MADQMTSGNIKFKISADGKQAVQTLGQVSGGIQKLGQHSKNSAKEMREMKKIGEEMASGGNAIGSIASMSMKAIGLAGVAGGIGGNLLSGAISGLIDMTLESYKEEMQRYKDRVLEGAKVAEEMMSASAKVTGMSPMEFKNLVKSESLSLPASSEALAALMEENPYATREEQISAMRFATKADELKLYSKDKLLAAYRTGNIKNLAEHGDEVAYRMQGRDTSGIYSMNELNRLPFNSTEFDEYKNEHYEDIQKNQAAKQSGVEVSHLKNLTNRLITDLDEKEKKTGKLDESDSYYREKLKEIYSNPEKAKDYDAFRKDADTFEEALFSLKGWKDDLLDMKDNVWNLDMSNKRINTDEKIAAFLDTLKEFEAVRAEAAKMQLEHLKGINDNTKDKSKPNLNDNNPDKK